MEQSCLKEECPFLIFSGLKPCSPVPIFSKEKYLGAKFLLFLVFPGSFAAALKIVVSYGNTDAALGGTAAAAGIFSGVF